MVLFQGEEKEEDLEEEEEGTNQQTSKTGEGRVKPAGEMTAPAASEDESNMVKRQHSDTVNDNNKEENNKEKAATKIQANFRGYKTRKVMKTVENKDNVPPQASNESKNTTDNANDSLKVQSARNSRDAENDAATKIQAGFRGMKTRQELKSKQNCSK